MQNKWGKLSKLDSILLISLSVAIFYAWKVANGEEIAKIFPLTNQLSEEIA